MPTPQCGRTATIIAPAIPTSSAVSISGPSTIDDAPTASTPTIGCQRIRSTAAMAELRIVASGIRAAPARLPARNGADG